MNVVMPGLVPGIHVLASSKRDVDGRDKPGHDENATHFVWVRIGESFRPLLS
jgi:hypothetical protein